MIAAQVAELEVQTHLDEETLQNFISEKVSLYIFEKIENKLKKVDECLFLYSVF